MSQPVSMPV
ncbi:hypothetical protein F383_22235 [Gossypium arboreum]|uniref:Uncharacterized protein n=1 Tax=Gossypium arboreum TaxID=29729 RepID=A0A0B0MN92_GOSAR|nr:hypothetical protein F383_22235 [Gossypium arboreum]